MILATIFLNETPVMISNIGTMLSIVRGKDIIIRNEITEEKTIIKAEKNETAVLTIYKEYAKIRLYTGNGVREFNVF